MRAKGRPAPPDERVTAAILATTEPDDDGCLISNLSPSRPRPFVYFERTSVSAIRIVAATALGRVIAANEEVHHRCGKRRCVRASCLQPLTVEEHSMLHAAELLNRGCVRHERPWDRLNGRGHGECILCDRETGARYRKKRGPRVLTAEQKARKNEWARANYRSRKRSERADE